MAESIEDIRWQLVRQTGRIVGDQSWLFEDALQEAMLIAWQRLEEGHSVGIAMHAAKQAAIGICRGSRMTGSKSSGRGVVDTYRRAIPLTRQGSEGEEFVIEPADHSTQEWIDQLGDLLDLARAMEPLSERDREIIYRRFWEGQDMDEIGKAVGLTHQAVSAVLKRTYPKLRFALRAS